MSVPSSIDYAARPPTPLTLFVGREREVAGVADLLRSPEIRLLTLTGPGGVGKTRLALRLADELAGDFPDGVAFVPLAAVNDPDLAAGAIGQALGLREGGDRSSAEVLATYLRERHLLLILDNFEQIVSGALTIASLLVDCRWLKVLVTSRVALRVSGEQEFPVPPLTMPDAERMPSIEELRQTEAVRLFMERARSVRPGFDLDETNAGAVAEICRRLDGLPLAIELAAARSKVLSPAALATRLTNRLQVLTSGPQDQPVRLQTMRAAIDWSHDLLTIDEQIFFRRLAVFVGGFTLDAAEAVGSEGDEGASGALDVVSSLVGKSLVWQEPETGDEPRFGMLETVREYGLGQLAASGEEAELRRRHAGWCLDLAERAWPAFVQRKGQEEWLDRFEAEHGNLRAALGWLARTGDAATALDLASRLFWFWYVRGYLREGHDWLERTLSANHGRQDEARARALLGLAMLAHWQGDDERAGRCLEESLAFWRQLDHAWGSTFVLGMLGVVAEDSGEFARAVPLLEEALALARAAGDRPNTALILDHLGVVAWGQDDSVRAVPFWEEALALHRAAGDTWGASISLSYLGMVAGQRGDYAAAEALHRESLDLRWAMGTKEDIAHCLANFAALAAARGHYERAARLFGAADAVQAAIGNTLKEPERTYYERAISMARSRLDEGAFVAAWTAGQALRIDAAVAEALAAPEVVGEVAPAPPKSAAAGGFGLTARELEVLRLLVDGRADREIADDLFISPRTAQGHVGSIYGKLGVNGRAAAVATALRAGLVADNPAPSDMASV